jgi:3',5'-cyclic AMP phosphodiesterase CpdA
MTRPLTVLHVSDFQCGTPFVPAAADAMHRVYHDVEPDLVVAAGDLTQRAKAREFARARQVVEGFGDTPVVVTPGNHDVPLYRVWERLAAPFSKWDAFVGSKRDTVTQVSGATVVALCSAAPRRAIVNGRLDPGQMAFARDAFADAPEGDVRILVVHHHFVPVPGGHGGRILPGADRLALEIAEMGTDVVMGGHVHQLHINQCHGVPFVATGTATSRRGRDAEAEANSLCVHRFLPGALEVTPYLRSVGEEDFGALEVRRFPLRARPAAVGVS